ncbi:MAG: hypothetical protein JJE40_17285 [Vicinamibacteria bacterium]|nr:hypothetical protein [Vicinamibacteria bacterium]
MAMLPEALAVTAAEAPFRTRPYALGTDAPRGRRVVDTAWARVLWKDLGPRGAAEMRVVGCARLIGIGVEVADRGRPGRWDFIDLLGIDSQNRLPVVIEMKGTRSASSPLGALVDAVAYGLALKKAWPHRLRADWARAVKEAGFGEPRLPVFLDRLTVIVAAPDTYWRAREEGQHPSQRRMSTAALQTVHAFVDALQYQGFDAHFASLSERKVGGRVCGLEARYHSLPRLGASDGLAHGTTM